MQLLVEAGANTAAEYGKNGDTALSLAAEEGDDRIVQLLLDRGAKTDVPASDAPAVVATASATAARSDAALLARPH